MRSGAKRRAGVRGRVTWRRPCAVWSTQRWASVPDAIPGAAGQQRPQSTLLPFTKAFASSSNRSRPTPTASSATRSSTSPVATGSIACRRRPSRRPRRSSSPFSTSCSSKPTNGASISMRHGPLDRTNAVPGGLLHELTTPSLSLRDLAVAMILQSDNTAANVLIDRLGMDAINGRSASLGLQQTRLRRRMIDHRRGPPRRREHLHTGRSRHHAARVSPAASA